MTKGPSLLPDPPPYLFLAFTPEQVRMLAVYSRVPRQADGELDLRVWARMASLPLMQAREVAQALVEMGAVRADGTVHKVARDYLATLARDELTGKRRRA